MQVRTWATVLWRAPIRSGPPGQLYIYMSKGQEGLNDIPGDVHGKTMSVDPDMCRLWPHSTQPYLISNDVTKSVYILMKQCTVDMDLLMSSSKNYPQIEFWKFETCTSGPEPPQWLILPSAEVSCRNSKFPYLFRSTSSTSATSKMLRARCGTRRSITTRGIPLGFICYVPQCYKQLRQILPRNPGFVCQYLG